MTRSAPRRSLPAGDRYKEAPGRQRNAEGALLAGARAPCHQTRRPLFCAGQVRKTGTKEVPANRGLHGASGGVSRARKSYLSSAKRSDFATASSHTSHVVDIEPVIRCSMSTTPS